MKTLFARLFACGLSLVLLTRTAHFVILSLLQKKANKRVARRSRSKKISNIFIDSQGKK